MEITFLYTLSWIGIYIFVGIWQKKKFIGLNNIVNSIFLHKGSGTDEETCLVDNLLKERIWSSLVVYGCPAYNTSRGEALAQWTTHTLSLFPWWLLAGAGVIIGFHPLSNWIGIVKTVCKEMIIIIWINIYKWIEFDSPVIKPFDFVA